ncbi:MAG: hypothetical protein A3K09_02140 [Nitrospinae bacterium RIFCSPLOWO2_12_FULL_47_7]|nr:MAG: hypothetical protein A3K09_02140 [Nitrospinae bacterium RIFCSPLOWO2_12_FULL_47_7]
MKKIIIVFSLVGVCILWTFTWGEVEKEALVKLEEMVYVPAGKFIMGANDGEDDEKPMHEVFLKGFYMDKYEVTNAQYKKFKPAHTFPTGREDFPVVNVSWYEAGEYAKWAGKRLPIEVEWEKAARGTDGRKWPWGNVWDKTKCNTSDSGIWDSVKVGSYPQSVSPYSCYDMAGNVWEWTDGDYNAYQGNTIVNTNYGKGYKVMKGGSWFGYGDHGARCSDRYISMPYVKDEMIGFRCAKDE